MAESPITATAYEILGVRSSASQDELRLAYRRLQRETHPDTGGSAARFIVVQRAWSQVGTEADRAVYDRAGSGFLGAAGSSGATGSSGARWAPHSAPAPQSSRPRARSYGHPGGWRRERYLTLMREWVGRGENLENPYDPLLVRSAPREIRHILADALAEELTARTLAELGIGFTVWHDVATTTPEAKIDHIVLGPTGLYALLSEDFGEPVRVRKGELFGAALGDGRLMHELADRAKRISRAAGVKFSALVIILPDDELDDAITVLGRVRGASTIAVRQSMVTLLLRDGIADVRLIGGNELFDVRTRLHGAIRFV